VKEVVKDEDLVEEERTVFVKNLNFITVDE
jgi:hypothetical protein